MASRRIEDLDKRYQPLVRQLLDEANKVTAPWVTFITDGFRTYAEQAKIYASGRTTIGKILTNAKPGTSNHEKGLAVDLAFQNGGKLSYEQSLYNKVVPIAKKLGIAWGGEWTGFPDKPHFEKLTFPAVVTPYPMSPSVQIPTVTPPDAPVIVRTPENTYTTTTTTIDVPNVVPVPNSESFIVKFLNWIIGLLTTRK